MFRDSRGVVHTVAAADPLEDLPAAAAEALRSALLREDEADLGSALERAEAASDLLVRWQDAFFAALPDEVDLEEEARWAAEAGLSLEDVEATEYDEDDDELDLHDHLGREEGDEGDAVDLPGDLSGDLPGDLEAELAGLALVDSSGRPVDPDDPRPVLGEELVQVLERELLLLPLRVRLEALVAAGDLVEQWAELLTDHEKLLGHLVLAHGAPQEATAHEELAGAHARLHAAAGAGHR